MVEGGSEDEEIVNTYVLRAEYMLFVYLFVVVGVPLHLHSSWEITAESSPLILANG